MTDDTKYPHLIPEAHRLRGRGQTFYQIGKALHVDLKTAEKLTRLPVPANPRPPLGRGQVLYALHSMDPEGYPVYAL